MTRQLETDPGPVCRDLINDLDQMALAIQRWADDEHTTKLVVDRLRLLADIIDPDWKPEEL